MLSFSLLPSLSVQSGRTWNFMLLVVEKYRESPNPKLPRFPFVISDHTLVTWQQVHYGLVFSLQQLRRIILMQELKPKGPRTIYYAKHIYLSEKFHLIVWYPSRWFSWRHAGAHWNLFGLSLHQGTSNEEAIKHLKSFHSKGACTAQAVVIRSQVTCVEPK